MNLVEENQILAIEGPPHWKAWLQHEHVSNDQVKLKDPDNLSGSHFSPQKNATFGDENVGEPLQHDSGRMEGADWIYAWYCTFAPCELTEHSCFRPRWWVLTQKLRKPEPWGCIFGCFDCIHACVLCMQAPGPRTWKETVRERGSQCAFWCKWVQAAST